MKLSENLTTLRKQFGYSQEVLANKLNVSRQSVSKWESGQSIPELDRLIEMADIFNVTLDVLVHGIDGKKVSAETIVSQENLKEILKYHTGYEYKSKRTIRGIPMIHIHIGRGMRVAKGIVAIGNVAVGIVAIGGFALGMLSIAGVGLGGVIFGGIAAGGLAVGGVALGYLALGGVAIGIYTMGAVSVAKELAIGAIAYGDVAIGANVKGVYTLNITPHTTGLEIKSFIMQHSQVHVLVQKILFFFLP